MQQIKVLSGGAAQGLIGALEPRFAAETGAGIDGTFSAVGAMRDKLLAGAAADLVILSRAMIGALVASGHLEGPGADLGVVRTAVAVRAGDAVPAIATADELRGALLAADALYTPDPKLATAGIHFIGVLDKLGIKAAVLARVRTFPNGMTAMRAMAAEPSGNPIGCTQVTEILHTPGLALVGALPQQFELATVYTAAVTAHAGSKPLARRLMALLCGADAAAARRQCGFEAA